MQDRSNSGRPVNKPLWVAKLGVHRQHSRTKVLYDDPGMKVARSPCGICADKEQDCLIIPGGPVSLCLWCVSRSVVVKRCNPNW